MWWLSAAWTLASVADNFLLFVLLWIAEPQGWSGVTTALVVLAIRLPTLLGGPLGGVAVDRFGPHRMMLLDGTVRVVLMVGLMVAGRNGDYPIAAVLVLGAMAGTTAPFTYAAARTLAPRRVAAPQQGRANTVLSVGDQLPMLVGAALGGSSLAVLGPSLVFAVPLVLLLGLIAISVRLLRSVPMPQENRSVATAGVGESPWRSPRVLALIALSVAYYFAYGPFETVLPYFVREELHTDVGAYTTLWIGFGAGALAGLPPAGVPAPPTHSARSPGACARSRSPSRPACPLPSSSSWWPA
jgi:MFS family permease